MLYEFFVGPNSYSYRASVHVVMYTLSSIIGLRYNGNWLYLNPLWPMQMDDCLLDYSDSFSWCDLTEQGQDRRIGITVGRY